MTVDEQIIQTIYETLDHMPMQDRRRRSVDHALAARKARRAGDMRSVSRHYMLAAKELHQSSNDKSHRAIRLLEEEARRLEYKYHG